ncbi:HPP family protein [Halopseudomonas oceani]|uniref:HPP family protein n=1 Tax=Halopseudomonas oceani TaxID=1708783 RepID=UPI002AA8B1B9|nr:HPP family protein [Halopseudomonas oceani]
MNDHTQLSLPASRQGAPLLGGQLATRPRELLRATVGAALGLSLSVWLCQQVFGTAVATLLIGPVGASAILLFAVPSGALAQPWSILGGYLTSAVVATAVAQLGGHSLPMASLAVCLSLLAMFMLRCLHPPGGAVALCVVLAGPALQALGERAILPVMLNAISLLTLAVLYNNLTGVRYPKRAAPKIDLHRSGNSHTALRSGITGDDLDTALEGFGGFVDLTREDLGQLIERAESASLQRRAGAIRAADIMTREVHWISPEATVREGLDLLGAQRLRVLPVVDSEQRLVGIVTLVDLASVLDRGRFRLLRRRLGERAPISEVMTAQVTAVPAQAPITDLVPLLSERGLHALPVLEGETLVGLVTQTDLISALHRRLLNQRD